MVVGRGRPRVSGSFMTMKADIVVIAPNMMPGAHSAMSACSRETDRRAGIETIKQVGGEMTMVIIITIVMMMLMMLLMI